MGGALHEAVTTWACPVASQIIPAGHPSLMVLTLLMLNLSFSAVHLGNVCRNSTMEVPNF
jgi:hypothetical protein